VGGKRAKNTKQRCAKEVEKFKEGDDDDDNDDDDVDIEKCTMSRISAFFTWCGVMATVMSSKQQAALTASSASALPGAVRWPPS
jgi:hypothetical protein